MAMCMRASDGSRHDISVDWKYRAFAIASAGDSERLPSQLAAPNWLMFNVGRALTTRQYFNLEVMATLDRWTLPSHGYAELLQLGERRADGTPYVDAQHPHSSPLMGLTLSDTVDLSGANAGRLRLFAAPRGASTDGPVAFMHRPSADHNPDTPLGHHLAQDVGHISSTVIGAAWILPHSTWEISGFHGAEPSPMHVDLPLGRINSLALRYTHEYAPQHRFMVSYAEVGQPEGDASEVRSAIRWSASLYDAWSGGAGWKLDHSLLFGRLLLRPGGPTLHSLLDELDLRRGPLAAWGRVEILQRSPLELLASAGAGAADPRWVEALTLGITRQLGRVRREHALSLGASLTVDALPEILAPAYGSRNPVTARLILQFDGQARHTANITR